MIIYVACARFPTSFPSPRRRAGGMGAKGTNLSAKYSELVKCPNRLAWRNESENDNKSLVTNATRDAAFDENSKQGKNERLNETEDASSGRPGNY